ncbi:MAG: VOC family protein [Anaerolineae bacterium]|jgi:catechol 2,3-dioxygenase|nr:VOC family protein [Anaerolineae bacterium]MCZ7553508.1 VOC family protein [Anaerolineales bacterium]
MTQKLTLPAQTAIGGVTLQVSDLAAALAFYRDLIGLEAIRLADARANLGAGGTAFLRLEELRGAAPQPPNTTGLYHTAIRFPDRRSLAVKIGQLAQQQIPLGQGDHWVSEAFYLDDPDGNGVELYRDRPRSEWQYSGAAVQMGTDPIDLEGFFAELGEDDPAALSFAAPAATRIGHMHLRVADLDASQRFYCDLLGFDLQARLGGALFVSAGGYHHHLGMNVWQTRGASPPAQPCCGMREFSLRLPAPADLERLAAYLADAGLPLERGDGAFVIHDPASIRIRLEAG